MLLRRDVGHSEWLTLTCISYFAGAVVEYHGQARLMEERVYSGLQSQKVHNSGEDMVADS